MSALFTLACPARTLAAAQTLADQIDSHPAIDALAVSVNEVDEAKALWSTVAYFTDEPAAAVARNVLQIEAEISPVVELDWVKRSLAGLPPVVAGRFQIHGSHDRWRRRAGGIALEIDAGTAFGTGHHATTMGCLLLLDRLLKRFRPERVFDLGCGTGVLALAAARATGGKVLATDIDPVATQATLMNARRNGLGPLIETHTAPGLHHHAIHGGAPFDLIFANILARPLAQMAQGLSQLLAPGGIVILSGITPGQVQWIAARYRAAGFASLHFIRTEGWAALAMKRTGINAKRPESGAQRGSRRCNVSAKGPGWGADL